MTTDEEVLRNQVQFEIVDQVAWITINNPEKGNAMSPDMRDRMTSLFEATMGQWSRSCVDSLVRHVTKTSLSFLSC